MEHIRHYLLIDAPIEAVYEALTTQQGVEGWWTKEAVIKPEVGFLNEFIFGDAYHNAMRVTQLKPNEYVEWLVIRGDKEWVDTNICFVLQEKDGRTVVDFTHKNWRKATDFYGSCNYHWAFYLRSLKLLCETGTGNPFNKDAPLAV